MPPVTALRLLAGRGKRKAETGEVRCDRSRSLTQKPVACLLILGHQSREIGTIEILQACHQIAPLAVPDEAGRLGLAVSSLGQLRQKACLCPNGLQVAV